MDARLLELLVCPVSRAPLTYERDKEELWCRDSHLAYPVKEGVPVMLAESARQLTESELESLE
ncbi:MAG: Trm112 family protein [Pseudomonadota bacterium]